MAAWEIRHGEVPYTTKIPCFRLIAEYTVVSQSLDNTHEFIFVPEPYRQPIAVVRLQGSEGGDGTGHDTRQDQKVRLQAQRPGEEFFPIQHIMETIGGMKDVDAP